MAIIDIGDVDIRTIALTVQGASGAAVVSIQFVPSGTAPVLANYVVIHQTSGSSTTYDLPFGTAISLTTLGVGTFYPVVRVVDGSTITTQTGDSPIQIANLKP